eukprot:CAMPEP_0197651876 /NCGR_PEP_ID=MMETSP1338-20131121/34106_1 /TAXON_ID=43686 ORGANISM="Pelagodinium beii, Strain RCC1491" /NCGR_SAMPLE_ID=MMETSP1338 /ASSEMBLY_ACC=CAM_ASM_000754 /LENGTH=354 /DNA_ID=CAMNT_0043226631 /DNA_START=65 /DNA_END=1129 /DNA_ORIENTATION=+
MHVSLFHILLALVALAEANYKILFYWSVDSDPQTQKKVIDNVAHAKSDDQGGPNCCHVMLSHYAGNASDWDQTWYQQHVVLNRSGSGFKYRGLKELYNSGEFHGNWADHYEWVFALDSDIDLTALDFPRFFELARNSGAVIVTPTFTGPSGQWANFNLKSQENNKKDDYKSNRHALSRVFDSTGAALKFTDHVVDEDADALKTHEAVALQIHVLGRPDENCQYRHTSYVEMTAPIIHMKVLDLVLNQCEGCIGEKAEWGLDRVWCNHVKKGTGIDKPCAYVDETSVQHLDWKKAQSSVSNGVLKDSENAVKKSHGNEWASVEMIDCIPRPGKQASSPPTGPPVNGVAPNGIAIR